jgi:2-(1,2-epoxy-1,2-dihydrophenyl)acetyl-CoA isomerase
MTGQRIEFQVIGNVARIVLANPGRLNAIDASCIRELAEAAAACAGDASLVAIVLAHQGDAFSVGGDLRDFIAHRDRIRHHIGELAAVFHSAVLDLRRAPAPVIAAVSGIAAGAGFSIVCGADMVVATASARFTSAYTKSGLTPDGGGTWFLPRLVGHRRAFDLMATNPMLSAEEARALGIVSRVVADGTLEAAVETLVAELAALPAGAVAGLKALLRRDEDAGLDAHLRAEAESIAGMAARPTTLARLEAFLSPKPR